MQNVGTFIESPGVPKAKTPLKLQPTNASKNIVSDFGESNWKRECMDILDLVNTELGRRFDLEGMKAGARREGFLMIAVNQKKPLFGANVVQTNRIGKIHRKDEFSLFRDLTKSKIFNTI